VILLRGRERQSLAGVALTGPIRPQLPCKPRVAIDTRVYDADDARAFLAGEGFQDDMLVDAVDGKFVSAFVRGTKPVSGCAPGCCSR
jgi:hypothetical protein